jgi:hypothetical protein
LIIQRAIWQKKSETKAFQFRNPKNISNLEHSKNKYSKKFKPLLLKAWEWALAIVVTISKSRKKNFFPLHSLLIT